MSDESYGDVDRFLLHSPLPEDDEPVATHDGGPQQHVTPADDHALEQAPLMLDPAIDALDQPHGFPEAPAPPLAAAATGVDEALSSLVDVLLGDPEGQALYQQFMRGEDDNLAAATGVNNSFEGMFHGDPEAQSLYQQIKNDLAAAFDAGSSNATAGDAAPATGVVTDSFEGMFHGNPEAQSLYQEIMNDLAAPFDAGSNNATAGDAAAATGVDDSFEAMFHGDPEAQSLYQQIKNDMAAAFDAGRNNATAGDAAAATGDDDSFEAMFHGNPAQSLYQEIMNDLAAFDVGSNATGDAAPATGIDDALPPAFEGAAVEPNDDVRPVEEHAVFVPFVPGQLDCTNCHTVWEALEESANQRHYLAVHGTGLGTFHHLITHRMYIGDDGQSTTSEQMMYLDLEQRTTDWVRSFIANLVEALHVHSSGQLRHSWSTSCALATTSSSTTPPVDNDAHIQLEFDMLKHANATNEEAVAVPQTDPDQAPHQPIIQQAVENSQDDDIFDGTSWNGLNPPTMDPSDLSAQYPSLLAEQRKRLSSMSMEDVMKFLHLSKEEAAKQLKISASSLQRLCHKNSTGRWPGRKISALTSQIEKLEQAALRNVGTTRLLEIKEQIDELKNEIKQIYESFMAGIIRENEMKKGAGSSGSK